MAALKIGQVATGAGVSVETVQFYEFSESVARNRRGRSKRQRVSSERIKWRRWVFRNFAFGPYGPTLSPGEREWTQ